METEEQEVGAFTPKTAGELLDTHRRLIASGLLDIESKTKKPFPLEGKSNETSSKIYFRNDSTYTIPAYGLMQPTGTVDISGSFNYVTVKRPIDAGLLRCPLLINGPNEIEVDGYGFAQSGPIYRLLHDNAFTYAAGDRLGAKTGGFSATYGGLFAVIGDDDVGTDIVRVMFDTSAIYGKTKASPLVAGTPANVYVYDAAGTLTTKEYLAETLVSDIAADTRILLIPTFGRLFASEIC